MNLPIKEKSLVIFACVVVVCAMILAVTLVAIDRPEMALEVAKGIGIGILAMFGVIFLISVS